MSTFLFSAIYVSFFFLLVSVSSKQQLQSAGCCQEEIKANYSLLFSCIMEFNQQRAKIATDRSDDSRFILYTYATDSILDYSSYSIAINSIYAAIQHYSFQFTSPGTGHQYYANDERWNKVRILMHAMEKHASATITAMRSLEEGNNPTYVIFLDADLIFLDFDMDLESITSEYHWADMIISRDSEPKNGIINSGFIIVRSCKWSYDFLNKWWGTSEVREMATDQHAFSTIWMENKEELERHVALLEPDAINSYFPAWKNQKLHNPVLHLAGGSSVFRIIVFKTGFDNICNTLKEKQKSSELGRKDMQLVGDVDIPIRAADLPPQLGLDVDYLSQVERTLPLRAMIDELVRDIVDKFCSLCEEKRVTTLELIEAFRKKIRNIFQRGQGASISAHQREELSGIIAAVRLVFLKLFEEIENMNTSTQLDYRDWTRFELLQDLISSGFELAVKISELSHFEAAATLRTSTYPMLTNLKLSDHISRYDLQSYCVIISQTQTNSIGTNSTAFAHLGDKHITFDWRFELMIIMNKLTKHVIEVMEMVKVLKPDDYRKLLYFKFKHLSFLSDAFVSAGLQWRNDNDSFVDVDVDALTSIQEYEIKALCGRHYGSCIDTDIGLKTEQDTDLDLMMAPPAICFLEKAIEVWEEMHALKFYGYGRGVQYADPYSEGVHLMDRVATFYCFERKNKVDYKFALQLYGRAVELSQEIWGSDGSKAPDAVFATLMEIHKRAHYCYRLNYQRFEGFKYDHNFLHQLRTFLELEESAFEASYPFTAYSIATDATNDANKKKEDDTNIKSQQKRVYKRKKKFLHSNVQISELEVRALEV